VASACLPPRRDYARDLQAILVAEVLELGERLLEQRDTAIDGFVPYGDGLSHRRVLARSELIQALRRGGL
jgi:hypothetical protein